MSEATPRIEIEIEITSSPPEPRCWSPFPPGGAESVFVGRTRPEEHPAHGRLVSLDYEGYRPMVKRVLGALAEDAASRWPCLAIRIQHALGTVEVGQASVCIEVVCLHRDEAFTACRWLIDELKATSPIWKRQCWSDGSTWVEGEVVGAGGEASG